MNTIASTTLVIAAFLVVISAVQPIAARLHVPFTVLLACVGVLVGGVSTFVVDHARLEPVLEIAGPLADLPISAPVFLTVFLPLLLFHAALTIDLREIARDIGPILTLAILAVFAAAAAIGFGLSLAGVPLAVGLLLGAIVATTDPAAVIAIFRELGAPPRLTRLLEGESLLNDAAAIVLFGILIEMLAGGAQSSISDAALDFASDIRRRPRVRRDRGEAVRRRAALARQFAHRRGDAVAGAALHRLHRRRARARTCPASSRSPAPG